MVNEPIMWIIGHDDHREKSYSESGISDDEEIFLKKTWRGSLAVKRAWKLLSLGESAIVILCTHSNLLSKNLKNLLVLIQYGEKKDKKIMQGHRNASKNCKEKAYFKLSYKMGLYTIYLMISQLLGVKDHINAVLEELGWDGLMTSQLK